MNKELPLNFNTHLTGLKPVPAGTIAAKDRLRWLTSRSQPAAGLDGARLHLTGTPLALPVRQYELQIQPLRQTQQRLVGRGQLDGTGSQSDTFSTRESFFPFQGS